MEEVAEENRLEEVDERLAFETKANVDGCQLQWGETGQGAEDESTTGGGLGREEAIGYVDFEFGGDDDTIMIKATHA
ncbi:hypothetical protein VNO77_30406 [Canavalia gladiata]|uniref:Uncharacterized protein n=1 Tax=Canavalia gladiata TaxID=3824 RepID=A0AAN9KNE6_CANGL